jgi:hypothetical protein
MSGIDQHLAKNTAEVSAKGHLKVTIKTLKAWPKTMLLLLLFILMPLYCP